VSVFRVRNQGWNLGLWSALILYRGSVLRKN
jgi:hypothetical protein